MFTTGNRRLLFVILLSLLSVSTFAQRSSETLVREVWDNLSKWFVYRNAIEYKENAEKCFDKQCIINDAITDRQGQGDAKADRWFNFFESLHEVHANVNFAVNELAFKYNEPSLSSSGEWIYANITISIDTSGRREYIVLKDYFRVKEGKIFAVNSSGSDMMIALDSYHNSRFGNAFTIFRKIAQGKFSRVESQYYTTVMLIKGEGCGHLSDEMRMREAAWWSSKGYLTDYTPLKNIYLQYFSDNKFLYQDKDLLQATLCTYPFCCGLIPFYSGGKYGYKNEYGESVIPAVYDIAYGFNGLSKLAVVCKDGKYGCINTYGQFVINNVYDYISPICAKESYFVKKGSFIITLDVNTRLEKRVGGLSRIIGQNLAYCVSDQSVLVDKTLYSNTDFSRIRCDASNYIVMWDGSVVYYNGYWIVYPYKDKNKTDKIVW